MDFRRFEEHFTSLPFRVCLRSSTGAEHAFGSTEPVTEGQAWDIRIVSKTPRTDRALARVRLLKILNSYVEGDIDVDGDFRYFCQMKQHLKDPESTIGWNDRILFLLHLLVKSSPAAERLAARHHYDQPIDFVEGYLDGIVKAHACCVFGDPMSDPTGSTMSLEDAAINREHLICQKLEPEGKSLLDVGCGSGYLVNMAVKEYGARRAYGVTLSENQKSDADKLFKESGTTDRCRVDIKNYRDLDGQFDVINSVGMVSHIGLGMLDYYWEKIASLLAPGGRYHHHCFMTYNDAGAMRDSIPLFSKKWVWPNFHWYKLGEHIEAAENQHFEIIDIKCLRLHYARTIDHWYQRFLDNMEQNRQLVPESTIRAWRAYLANMAIGFRQRQFTVNQLLCRRLEKKVVPVVANLGKQKEKVAAH